MKGIVMPANYRKRTVCALLILVLLPILGGALISPYIFNMLVLLGRNFESLQGLRNLEFESVATRTMLVGMLLALWPALSLAGNPKMELRSLFVGQRRTRDLLVGLFVGIATMIVVPLGGLLMSAYKFGGNLNGLLLEGSAFLLAALLVAFLEELLFRGMLFGMLWRVGGLAMSVILSSTVFSLVHFLKPIKPAGVVHGHWYSGFRLIAKAATSFDLSRTEIFPYCMTLFMIAVSLCLIFSVRKNLYLIAGIHAGWIWVLKMAGSGLERTEGFSWLFGTGTGVEKSYAALIVSTLFCVATLFWRSKKMAVGEIGSRVEVEQE